MNKQDLFIEWICGKLDAEFPFFKNLPKVPQVKIIQQGLKDGRYLETPSGEIVEPDKNNDR